MWVEGGWDLLLLFVLESDKISLSLTDPCEFVERDRFIVYGVDFVIINWNKMLEEGHFWDVKYVQDNSDFISLHMNRPFFQILQWIFLKFKIRVSIVEYNDMNGLITRQYYSIADETLLQSVHTILWQWYELLIGNFYVALNEYVVSLLDAVISAETVHNQLVLIDIRILSQFVSELLNEFEELHRINHLKQRLSHLLLMTHYLFELILSYSEYIWNEFIDYDIF